VAQIVAADLNPLRHRRTIAAPKNPVDICTVISIYPKLVDETKPTIQPGRFIIQPGSFEKPSFLVVTSSSWWREIDENQPLLEIPNHSAQVAESIVRDYCNGIVGCDMSDNMPGLFWITGEVDLEKLKTVHATQLIRANQRQINWWNTLVMLADKLWNNSGGNPITISEDMRLAARMLNVDANKDWMKNFKMLENVRCVACGFPRDPLFPICPNCKAVIDPEKATELGLQFAKLG